MIGKPDLVLKMPEEYTVQATGTVAYKYFVTPTNFEEDMWVQASEARPGNWNVVHHIIAFVREKGSENLQNLPHVGGYAPGEEPLIFPEGIGLRIPAGAEIVWQVHYTPTGKVETDRSEVGLIFCKEPPQRHTKGGGAFNVLFSIPPGAESHRVTSSKRFNQDVELLSLMPHMHLRGKDFQYTARFPDGTSQVLLSVPNYDFNWQHRYRFATPISLPTGTTLDCVAHFDNSADNPANPDPDEDRSLGRPDLGGNDDRLVLARRRSARGNQRAEVTIEATDLNPQEDFAAVHPVKNQPIHGQHRQAQHEGLVGFAEPAEQVGPQVSLERRGYELVEQVRDQVGGNRVHADHAQQKCPGLESADVHYRIEGRQNQKAPATAEDRPAGRPNALYARRYAAVVQKLSDREAGNAGEKKPRDCLGRRGDGMTG